MNSANESDLFSGGKQSRREFIASCSALTAGMFVFPTFITSSYSSPIRKTARNNALINFPKTELRVICAHPDPNRPNWPNIGYDFSGDIQRFVNLITTKSR
jgi:hypothetical protein